MDWLAGKSIGLFPLTQVTPEDMVNELNTIFGTDQDSPLAGMVRFQPINRLNALLVISAQSAYLNKVEQWIERFGPQLQRRAESLCLLSAERQGSRYRQDSDRGFFRAWGESAQRSGRPTGARFGNRWSWNHLHRRLKQPNNRRRFPPSDAAVQSSGAVRTSEGWHSPNRRISASLPMSQQLSAHPRQPT